MSGCERTAVTIGVPAKVNLALHVTGQRADGFHDLDSLVAFTEKTYDAVTVRFGAATAPALSLSGPFAPLVPPGVDNAVLAAARATGGIAHVHLEKGLPVAAGLGGGAADAAAVLRAALTRGLRPPGTLAALAETLGADVPVCFAGRSCRMSGIGEIIEPVALPPVAAVLVNPRIPVATAAVFARLADRAQPALPALPALDGADTLIGWLNEARNDLAAPAAAMVPEIEEIRAALAASPGCGLARMSGSGATVFGLFAREPDAEAAARELGAARRWWVSCTRLCAAAPGRAARAGAQALGV